MKERLQKILAQSTELSRRAAEKAIVAGEVTVNGRVVTKLGTQADSYKDKVAWKGKRVRSNPKKIAILYYKPKNVMVTKSDPEGRTTIWEKGLKDFKNRLNSAGRLDYDSEGLLILSDNGEFINRLTHPSHEVKKIYEVKVKGFPNKEDLDKLRKGLTYMDVEYQPARVFLKSKTGTNTWLKIEIHEGKNRQVRKMFEAIGATVIKLKRTAIGNVRLGKMKPSEWRYLTQEELLSLFKPETI